MKNDPSFMLSTDESEFSFDAEELENFQHLINFLEQENFISDTLRSRIEEWWDGMDEKSQTTALTFAIAMATVSNMTFAEENASWCVALAGVLQSINKKIIHEVLNESSEETTTATSFGSIKSGVGGVN